MLSQFHWTPRGFRRKHAVVVTFASGRYQPFLTSFRREFAKHSPDMELLVFTHESEIGSPPHQDIPYAFKVYSIEAARRQGYEIVLWCDSILKLTRPIETILPTVERAGVYLAEDGWKTGMFANDRALEYFGVSRDEAMQIPAIWACFMGFDFRTPIAHEFFRHWKQACDTGIFRGKWTNETNTESQDSRCKGHRHDQTCAELISHQMGIPRCPAVLHPDPAYGHRYFTGREW